MKQLRSQLPTKLIWSSAEVCMICKLNMACCCLKTHFNTYSISSGLRVNLEYNAVKYDWITDFVSRWSVIAQWWVYVYLLYIHIAYSWIHLQLMWILNQKIVWRNKLLLLNYQFLVCYDLRVIYTFSTVVSIIGLSEIADVKISFLLHIQQSTKLT